MIIENLDSFFTIAHQHEICQDYTLAGFHPFPHLIICDGCSTSGNTDVGARVLAMSARKFLHESVKLPEQPFPSYHETGMAIIAAAKQVVKLMGLEPACLDATLMLAVPVHTHVIVYAFGDGYIVQVTRSGELVYTKISYDQNMPYYLTYWIDKDRSSLYLLHNKEGEKIVTLTEYRDELNSTRVMDYHTPLTWGFSSEETWLVALMSDGAASFLSGENQQKLPTKDVLQQLVAYKTTKGDFVKRRTKRMLKNNSKQGIHPVDDVSVAAMLLTE